MAGVRGRTSRWAWALGVALAGATLAGCVPDIGGGGGPTTTEPTVVVGDDQIRLNQIQLVGSHNSYHIAPEGTILIPLTLGGLAVPGLVEGLGNPLSLNYTHAPLPTQLQRGVRTFELDVYADPLGGRFSVPRLVELFNVQQPNIPPGLDQPGLKVLHIADVDFLTTCVTLQACLGQIRTWSDAHPGHLPIVIDVELKGEGLGLPAELGFTPIVPFDGPQLDAVDAELRAAIGDRLITPDDVRQGASTLREAITTTGWPTVAESRGKVLVFLDNEGLRSSYLSGHPSLEGRAMFTSSMPGQPDAAIIKENTPNDGATIRGLVEQGYIVRTRADDDTVPDPSVARREIALASGAQIVHTDYPPGEPRFNTGYQVTFGTKVASRCNPVTATAGTCTAAAVIEP